MHQLFVGVDGGGTKTTVRVEDEAGNVLGQANGGPANIRISVEQAWQSIYAALDVILKPLDISIENTRYPVHAGMGLAGCEVESAYQQFVKTRHPFQTLLVMSDAYAACMGAHGGCDGTIIIIGTGVAGFQIENNQTARAGGWGFPHDDQGGGAWLGLQAMSQALSWRDGRSSMSGLAQAVCRYFNDDLAAMVSWANKANSSQFAELAPVVITQVKAGDEAAIQLMRCAAAHIDKLDMALEAARHDKSKVLPCSLSGGIVEFIEPYLSARLRNKLTEKIAVPDKGAILMLQKSALSMRGVV